MDRFGHSQSARDHLRAEFDLTHPESDFVMVAQGITVAANRAVRAERFTVQPRQTASADRWPKFLGTVVNGTIR